MLAAIRVALASAALAYTVGPLAQEVQLRAVSAFVEGTTFARGFERFIARINSECKGQLSVNYIGGPKAMPTMELGNAVRSGVVDLAVLGTGFYTNLMPEADALLLRQVSAAELRRNGGRALIDKIHREKVNAVYLGEGTDHIPFHVYLTRRVERLDFKNLKLRGTSSYKGFFDGLGATLVQMPPGEVFTALDRGVVEGYGWGALGIFDLRWNEKTRYRVDPGFYHLGVPFLMHLPRYEKLSGAQRDCLLKQMEWIEAQNAEYVEIVRAEYKRQADSGIQTITLSEADAKRYLDLAYAGAWERVLQVSPTYGRELRQLLAK